MEYDVAIRGRTQKVTLVRDSEAGESYSASFSGDRESLRIEVLRQTPERLIISVDERMYSVRLSKKTPSAVEFLANGQSVVARIPHSGGSGEEPRSEVASVDEFVTANFPAKVVSMKAERGSRFKEGETLIILEAMKMEAQIKAPRDCEVLEIFVNEGEMVSRGGKLARLKFD